MINTRNMYKLYIKSDEVVNVGGIGRRPFYLAGEIKNTLNCCKNVNIYLIK